MPLLRVFAFPGGGGGGVLGIKWWISCNEEDLEFVEICFSDGGSLSDADLGTLNVRALSEGSVTGCEGGGKVVGGARGGGATTVGGTVIEGGGPVMEPLLGKFSEELDMLQQVRKAKVRLLT